MQDPIDYNETRSTFRTHPCFVHPLLFYDDRYPITVDHHSQRPMRLHNFCPSMQLRHRAQLTSPNYFPLAVR